MCGRLETENWFRMAEYKNVSKAGLNHIAGTKPGWRAWRTGAGWSLLAHCPCGFVVMNGLEGPMMRLEAWVNGTYHYPCRIIHIEYVQIYLEDGTSWSDKVHRDGDVGSLTRTGFDEGEIISEAIYYLVSLGLQG
jgi:hypothetical protein